MAEQMNVGQIRAALTTTWLGQTVHYWPAVGSTNDALRSLGSMGIPAGSLAITDFQSAGRGRLSRRWEAPAGSSLLLSLLFRPQWPAEQGAWLTMMTGLAAVEAISACTDLKPSLKWPNDIVIVDEQGGWRKLGGILMEGVFRDVTLLQAIVGMGLNVNISREQLPPTTIPATSLLVETGRLINRVELLSQFLTRLEQYYDAAQAGHSPYSAWQERLLWRNRPVMITKLNQPPLEGHMLGTDEFGQLQLQTADGTVHTLSAGDVSLRPAKK